MIATPCPGGKASYAQLSCATLRVQRPDCPRAALISAVVVESLTANESCASNAQAAVQIPIVVSTASPFVIANSGCRTKSATGRRAGRTRGRRLTKIGLQALQPNYGD